jgi:methionyl-tRNA formyltransferase
MKKFKTIFFGTPQFVMPVLETLAQDEHFSVVAVVTAPDKPVGRKQVLTPPPVKQFGLQHNIPVLQPDEFNNRASVQPASPAGRLNNLKPDLFIVAAYGKILPRAVIDIPKFGTINIHPSLLPKYRGPSPIQAQILNNEPEVGTTTMLMDEQVDHGPLLGKSQIQISESETFESLADKLFKVGADMLPKITKYVTGKIKPQSQNHSQATFTKIIKKQDGQIDWRQPADYIERMTRAYAPWPSAFGRLKNYELGIKIIKANVISNDKSDLEPGTIFKTSPSLSSKSSPRSNSGQARLAIACGLQTILIIDELQPAGKKKMTGQEFLNGHQSLFSAVV